MSISAEGELRAQHERWSVARSRLWGGSTPSPRPPRKRPVSPFSHESAKARRIVEQQRLHRLFPAVIVEIDDNGNEVPPEPVVAPWRAILDEVLDKHQVTFAEVMSHRRDKIVAAARFEAMWRLTKETSMSLPAIGRKFDRDHTSVLHAVRQHEKRMREATDGVR